MPLKHDDKLLAKPLHRPPANEPVPLTYSMVQAIQALERGDADQFQQKKVLEFIINHLSAPYHPDNWQPGQHSLNDFAAGRAFVGHQLLGALKVNLAYFINKENTNA